MEREEQAGRQAGKRCKMNRLDGVEGVLPTDGRVTPRLLSHTVVDVRPFRYLPLLNQSSFLLNISETGVLLEFVADPRIVSGRVYWMVAHLSPLGITATSALRCHLECRWVDTHSCRMGGAFVNLQPHDKDTIALALQHIRAQS